MNPKLILHNTTFSVQLPYIAGHFPASGDPPPSLERIMVQLWRFKVNGAFFKNQN